MKRQWCRDKDVDVDDNDNDDGGGGGGCNFPTSNFSNRCAHEPPVCSLVPISVNTLSLG